MIEDLNIRCVDCADEFVWTVGAQKFMQSLADDGKIKEVIAPKRCEPCRIRKTEKRNAYNRAHGII